MTHPKLSVVTPTLPSRMLSTPTRRVWLKLEYLQPTGSVKVRGAQVACTAKAAEGARRLLIASDGNAGTAVAHCARALGLPCMVVVPHCTATLIKVALRSLGAEVVTGGKTLAEAEEVMMALRLPGDGTIRPFDDSAFIEGYASLICEAQKQMPTPDAVVVGVGGGSLMSGVLQGMHAVGWTEVPLVACETFGAHALALAIAAGRPVKLPRMTSVAGALGAESVHQTAFDWTLRHRVLSEVVTDLQAVRAARDFADSCSRVIEPACAAVIAAARSSAVTELAKAQEVLVIVCGGMGTNYQDLVSMEEALLREDALRLDARSAPPTDYPSEIARLLRALPPH